MFKNAIGKSTLVASVAALVLAFGLVTSEAAGGHAATATERVQFADAAHWAALAQHYAEQQAIRQQALEAEAAHWRALAEDCGDL